VLYRLVMWARYAYPSGDFLFAGRDIIEIPRPEQSIYGLRLNVRSLVFQCKYPPAEPGALVREPPKAACVLRVPLFRAVGHLKVASLGYSKRS
jgi:hypothetical protein